MKKIICIIIIQFYIFCNINMQDIFALAPKHNINKIAPSLNKGINSNIQYKYNKVFKEKTDLEKKLKEAKKSLESIKTEIKKESDEITSNINQINSKYKKIKSIIIFIDVLLFLGFIISGIVLFFIDIAFVFPIILLVSGIITPVIFLFFAYIIIENVKDKEIEKSKVSKAFAGQENKEKQVIEKIDKHKKELENKEEELKKIKKRKKKEQEESERIEKQKKKEEERKRKEKEKLKIENKKKLEKEELKRKEKARIEKEKKDKARRERLKQEERQEKERLEQEKRRKLEAKKECKERERLENAKIEKEHKERERKKKEKQKFLQEIIKKNETIKQNYNQLLNDIDIINNLQQAKDTKDYFVKFVEKNKKHWNIKSYVEHLQNINILSKVLKISEEFILKTMIDIFSEIINQNQEKRVTKKSKKALYDEFMLFWFERKWDKLALAGTLKKLKTTTFHYYARILAVSLYKDNKNTFTYFGLEPRESYDDWEGISYWCKLFDIKKGFPIFRQQQCFHAIPIKRVKKYLYGFWHDSFIDYFVNNELERMIKEKEDIAEFIKIINTKLVNTSMLSFMVDSIKENPEYKATLFKIIDYAKKNKIASANARKALIKAGVLFETKLALLSQDIEYIIDLNGDESDKILNNIIKDKKINYTFLEFIKEDNSNEYSMEKFKEFMEIFEGKIKTANKSDQISISINDQTKNISKKEVLEVFQLILDKAA